MQSECANENFIVPEPCAERSDGVVHCKETTKKIVKTAYLKSHKRVSSPLKRDVETSHESKSSTQQLGRKSIYSVLSGNHGNDGDGEGDVMYVLPISKSIQRKWSIAKLYPIDNHARIKTPPLKFMLYQLSLNHLKPRIT